MIANKQPWSAVINTARLTQAPERKNSLTAVKKDGSQPAKTIYRTLTATAKRYSFDDNGGGYLGL